MPGNASHLREGHGDWRIACTALSHKIWLPFPLSFRDVEDLLAERGIDISYDTVTRGSLKFGQVGIRFWSTFRLSRMAAMRARSSHSNARFITILG
ncbi:hypothetical protein [Oricola nitratireducens]|uniref:hypothetical protein n=1 Tax=Oricola nitratireducens TaxID=2775868 RepID=UPI001868BAAA|nr:hypothetical protein [Oricola nitratireducens]